jgi:branched-chain amino acid transport system permease protein
MNDFFTNFLWTYQTALTQVAISSLLALAMYCVLATGQLFIGQIGFMAIGAYTSAVLTITTGLPVIVSIAVAVSLALVVALIMVHPMLRLSGVYMAIGTIAFGEVIRSVVINFDLVGGALGISGIPQSLSLTALYVIVVVIAVILVYAMYSRLGRNVEAVRTDELAAQAMGINVRIIKLGAVLASAGLAGLAGALSAQSLGSVTPNDFSFVGTVAVLSYAVLGGVASPIGAILGAVLLTVLPELLSAFSEFRSMVTGLAIVLVVMIFPSGLFPIKVIRIRGHAKR